MTGPQACSKICRQKRIEQTNLTKYGSKHSVNSSHARDKAKQTCLEKYGVEHQSQSEQYKAKVKATNIERYGVENAMQNPDIQSKARNTNRARRGVDYPTQSDEVKSKIRETVKRNGGFTMCNPKLIAKVQSTNIIKYGAINPMQNADIREKVISTNLKRYGVANPAQSVEIQRKIQSTNLSRYGTRYAISASVVRQRTLDTVTAKYGVSNVFESEEVKLTILQTNLEKYGVKNPMQDESVKQKVRDTCKERYGNEFHLSTDYYRRLRLTNPDKYDEFKSFSHNPAEYIQSNFNYKPTLHELGITLGVNASTISWYAIKHSCKELISYHISTMEQDVISFIKEVVPDIQLIHNDRTQIQPLELDIYLPEYNIGIECNPTYTHNSTQCSFDSEYPIHSNYHMNKSVLANKAGIFLFHIYGHEWVHKQDVIKSMIINLLGANIHKVYARNCYIDTVPTSDAMKFLKDNHLQGATGSKVKLGLFDKSDSRLLSMMTFGYLRNTLGRGSENIEGTYELSRFCTLKYHTVVGGAGKLFKHFVINYEPRRIVSFSDESHTIGGIYSKLGFINNTMPTLNYVWVDTTSDVAYNRVSCQKRNIRKLLHDDSIDIDNRTEKDIMSSNGFVQVFDSGRRKWVWDR